VGDETGAVVCQQKEPRARHGEGARIAVEEYLYYLRYQRDGKRIMEPAGRDSVAAVALATTREIELFAAERGQQVPGVQVVATNSRHKFADAAQAYLRQIAGGTKRSTYNAYRLALENFQEACPQCVYLDQVTADSLRAFVAWMRERLDQTTVYHRFSELLTFLAKNGIEVTLAKGDRPKRRVVSKDGTDIETYSDEDIRKWASTCSYRCERMSSTTTLSACAGSTIVTASR
jgi:hypothetical protein